MKKKIILTGALALSMMASTAFAAPGGNAGNKEKHEGNSGKVGAQVTVEVEGDSDGTVADSVYDSVSDSVYGHNGYIGLQHAYENVKNNPAGSRIAALLKTKYNIDVAATADTAVLVDSLEKENKLQAASDVQAEVILQDPSDLDAYRKLGKLKIKLGDKKIKTYVNGKTVAFDVEPVVVSGRTLVPFRAIAESLKAEVTYDAATKTVTVQRGDIVVKLVLGSNIASINGTNVTLSVPGKVKNNRILVPLRFLSEALDANVTWDAETSSAIIVDKTDDTSAQ